MMRSVFSHRVAFCWNVSPRLDALSRLASLLTPISSSTSLSLRLASGVVISFRRPIGIDFLVQLLVSGFRTLYRPMYISPFIATLPACPAYRPKELLFPLIDAATLDDDRLSPKLMCHSTMEELGINRAFL